MTIKRRGTSPVQRTLRALRAGGYICDIVERWLPHAGRFGKKVDMFNFADIVALAPCGIVAVQVCGKDFAEHKKKILGNEFAPEWLRSGTCPGCNHGIASIEIWGWRKVKKKRGGKQMIWAPRIEEIKMEDLEE